MAVRLFLLPLLAFTAPVDARAKYSHRHHHAAFSLPTPTVTNAKERLLSLAQKLRDDNPTGVFIVESSSKEDLMQAVAEMEAVCGPPKDEYPDLMVGEWSLLCTMTTPKFGKKENKPFGIKTIPEFLRKSPLLEKTRKSVEVTQSIRCTDDDDVINRVDNIVEFTPFSFSDVFNASSILKNLDLNPLEVSKSKVTLAHKAEVESTSPVLRTKLALQSIILTVAGTSQYLEPEGADVLGVNVPLGEFLNAGYFDTTYVDEEMRISRGSVGIIDQLRVFVRKEAPQSVVEDSEVAAVFEEEDPRNRRGKSDESDDFLDEI